MASLTREETYRFTHKLYQLLFNHSDHIFIRKLHQDVHGEYDPSTEDIHIDFRRDLISTLIHEAFHHWHPNWCETKVLEMESKVVNSLSQRQVKNVIKALANVL